MDPLSTSGSQANGGRYNDRGMAGVLYTSTDRTTAIAEVVRGLRLRGVDPGNFGPQDWWAYEIRVSLGLVVDLRDDHTLSKLGVTPNMIVGDDTTETRRIGHYSRDNGFQAILAPSAAVQANDNLVLFLEAIPNRPEVLSSSPVDLSVPG